MAQQMKREGRAIIVLGAGEPDFDTRQHQGSGHPRHS